ncbi:Uncharacterized membrane protein [Pseudarcicella hirudinis]|uniref:Uncharacterized membrane protein n=1 Tax=Pseudarcicella hirudinis TaxID=1079859 RepID=A0A1I5TUD8_9BACT|nr:DUF2231 domain-containing protein [Pseudarcicella hirudinis]SFP86664.1 Uncharacterized membrane protein [Pseudarcicella hirudinis]
MILLDIITFFGRLHPLIVHLPIGFLLLAVIFDLVSYFPKYQVLKSAVSFTLFAGFCSAVIACIFGYLLSLTGDYDTTLLRHHKNSGIGIALFSGILFLLTHPKVRLIIPVSSRIFSALSVCLLGLMSYSGHLGGNLTHGSDYLSLAELTKTKREKPVSAEQAFIFEDVVQPILEKRCSQCHQGGKLKGNLSVESLTSLKKGGKNGPAVVAGKLAESELFKRITLDPAHKEFMPSDGKTPLTKTETEIIRWWIEKAMATEGKKLAELKGNEIIKPQIASFLGLGGLVPNEKETEISQKINPAIPLTLDNNLVINLRNSGFEARVMLQKPVMLDITLPSNSGKKGSELRKLLSPLAKNIIWLNLSENGLTDNDFDFLKDCTNLEKLRVEKNPVSDAFSNYLSKMPHLEALNLNETKITESSLTQLRKLPSLKRIYTFGTSIKGPEDGVINLGSK